MELEVLLSARQNAQELAKTLDSREIVELAGLLSEKNNEIRYAALLVLQQRSRTHEDVYPLWDLLAEKLGHENSYQRSIGVMLLAENVRWDREDRLRAVWGDYAARFRDEKFITARQAIQSLSAWLSIRPQMHETVFRALAAIKVEDLPNTQRKLILQDIAAALLTIRETASIDGVDAYLAKALDSGLLDKKEKAALLVRMGGK